MTGAQTAVVSLAARLTLALGLLLTGCAADGIVDAAKVCEVVIAVGQAVLSTCK